MAGEERTWYLGPLGDLRPLECPETDITMNQIRYGGVHTALSGAATVDTTGTKMEYGLEFKYLDYEDWAWLDALNTRLVPGPFYLLDPMKTNRLSVEATKLVSGATSPEAVAYWRHSFQLSSDRPSGLNYPMRSLMLTGTTDDYPFRFNPKTLVPVLPQERVCGSVWMKADAEFQVTIGFDYYSDEYTRSTPDSAAQNVFVTTDWERYYYTAQVPSSANGVRFFVNPQGNGRDLSMCAPQFEPTFSPTGWTAGGAAPQVSMTDLRTSSHRFPIYDSSLTLLEA